MPEPSSDPPGQLHLSRISGPSNRTAERAELENRRTGQRERVEDGAVSAGGRLAPGRGKALQPSLLRAAEAAGGGSSESSKSPESQSPVLQLGVVTMSNDNP